ncbi:MAG: SpaH/EbpB family LPXTG-anchored major pilin [Lachnospiraceae bacterium]|nr:SpaH/EbpB family LPXTG-anchored major pilin [Lachnospiraceae bacterium]
MKNNIKKSVRRWLALAMTAIMLFAMATTASAATSLNGSQTVTVVGTDGATYTFYKIASVETSGDAYVYTVLSPYSGSYTAAQLAAVTGAANLQDLADVLAGLTNGVNATATLNYSAGNTSVTLAPGYYLMIADPTGTGLTAANSLFTVLTEAVTLDPKTSDVSMTKKIVDNDTYANPRDTSTADIGDTITYRIESTVPSYSSTATSVTYSITDNPSTGLTINTSNIIAKIGNSEISSSNYSLTTGNSDGGFTIVFNSDWVLANGGATVDVYFTATLNSDAVLAGNTNSLSGYETKTDVEDELYTTGNPNGAILTYSNNYKDGTGSETIKDIVTSFTFQLDVKKVDKTDNSILLSGAEFKIYTDSTCETEYTNTRYNNSLVSIDSGVVTAEGLDAGIYYLKETVAPDGYTLFNDIITVTIVAGTDSNSGEYDGTYSYTVKLGSLADTPDLDVVTVEDEKGLSLPGTGGIGTTLFTFGGLALVILAAIMFIVYTKKQRKQA